MTAAGVTFVVTRACTMGELPDCSCDKTTRRLVKKRTEESKDNSVGPDGEWEWGGCGDNINYGIRKSKDFMDTRYKKMSDMKTLVKLHNYAAGRLVRTTFSFLPLNGSVMQNECIQLSAKWAYTIFSNFFNKMHCLNNFRYNCVTEIVGNVYF